MKQRNRVFTDISICKMKELFVPLFVHFLCTLSVTCSEPFLREKCFFEVKKKCLGQTPTVLRKCKLTGKAF